MGQLYGGLRALRAYIYRLPITVEQQSIQYITTGYSYT
jgi:hypothetical protein